jgi:hypothetical protein
MEMGDVFSYLFQMAYMLNIDLDEMWDRHQVKVRERKYVNTAGTYTQAQVDAMQSQGANVQQIADIVWAKLWDVVYMLRMGMNTGSSQDPNIQGWINDLGNFIKKVK